jgi:prevent-host-death family protein
MIIANVKELKARLNRYLRLAEEGKVVLVTRRGRVVAEVRPAVKRRSSGRSVEEVMTSLAEQGQVDLPSRPGPVGLRPGVRVRDPKGALRLLDGLIEERKHR